jgi:cyclic pyranopterin phosphate synthase
MVVKKGANFESILPMARKFDSPDTILRFIEYMDVGTSNGWKLDEVVPSAEILELINKEMPIEPIKENYPGEVVKRWRYQNTGNEFGIITSVTQPFCGGCTRARLSASGSIYTCLFSNVGTDLKSLIRSGAPDQEILDLVTGVWQKRQDNYSEIRSDETTDLPKVEMSFIGG